jgi:hypothetical protein
LRVTGVQVPYAPLIITSRKPPYGGFFGLFIGVVDEFKHIDGLRARQKMTY